MNNVITSGQSVNITKPTVESLLKMLPSGIGLDVAKNHTGVVIWDGVSVTEYGFALNDYDSSDYFAEYKMRRDFKNKLKEIVNGKSFEYCIIEDVYGGENFDTVRKLLALNTVIDELIFENVCFVGNFYRWSEVVWMKNLRTLYKQRGKLKSKLETQGILEYLEYDFYLKHKDDTNKVKKEIFFEDKCDACGMLLSIVAAKINETNQANSVSVKMSDIKMLYVEDIDETFASKDVRFNSEPFLQVELNTRTLEKSIINAVSQHPTDLLIAYLPSSKLGVFGMKHNFTFYDSDEGYLLFYKK